MSTTTWASSMTSSSSRRRPRSSTSKYQTLRDSNRSSKPGWRPRIYNTTNPGNIGHGWYKQRFILPARAGKETLDPLHCRRPIDDNAFIDADYKRKLEENTGWRLRAYRFGDWDIAAGHVLLDLAGEHPRHRTV